MPAATALHDAAPATLKAWLERDDAILVDVREADEYAREHIAGARLHPLSRLTAAPLPRVPARSSCSRATAATGPAKRRRRSSRASRSSCTASQAASEAWKRDGLPAPVV